MLTVCNEYGIYIVQVYSPVGADTVAPDLMVLCVAVEVVQQQRLNFGLQHNQQP